MPIQKSGMLKCAARFRRPCSAKVAVKATPAVNMVPNVPIRLWIPGKMMSRITDCMPPAEANKTDMDRAEKPRPPRSIAEYHETGTTAHRQYSARTTGRSTLSRTSFGLTGKIAVAEDVCNHRDLQDWPNSARRDNLLEGWDRRSAILHAIVVIGPSLRLPQAEYAQSACSRAKQACASGR